MTGDVFDMLMSFSDFEEFKGLMLSHKAQLGGGGGVFDDGGDCNGECSETEKELLRFFFSFFFSTLNNPTSSFVGREFRYENRRPKRRRCVLYRGRDTKGVGGGGAAEFVINVSSPAPGKRDGEGGGDSLSPSSRELKESAMSP